MPLERVGFYLAIGGLLTLLALVLRSCQGVVWQ
jgi:hypothetical protein